MDRNFRNMKYLKNFNESNEFSGEWNGKRWQEHFKKLKEDPEYKTRWIEWRDNQVIEYWNELKPFQTESDVPDLPKPLTSFFIDKLIELGAIPKEQLKDGVWYYGNFRNSEFGRWNETKQVFEHIRYKFGNRWDSCNHFQDDNGYALFVPLREVNDIEKDKIEKIIDEMDKEI